MDKALNHQEIEQIAGKRTNAISYQDLNNIPNIDELFIDHNSNHV